MWQNRGSTAHTPGRGNYGILLPVVSKKIRQINVLLKNFTINWFDEKNFAWQWILRFSTLCFSNFHTMKKSDFATFSREIIVFRKLSTYMYVHSPKTAICKNIRNVKLRVFWRKIVYYNFSASLIVFRHPIEVSW